MFLAWYFIGINFCNFFSHTLSDRKEQWHPATHTTHHARPRPVDRMTDACENITFPQLLLRTVKIVFKMVDLFTCPGLTPEMILSNPLYAYEEVGRQGFNPDFETQGRHHQKSKTRMPPKN